jgi:LPS export ABC transporter protein LptC
MMVWRVMFALLSLAAIGTLLYLRASDDDGIDLVSGEPLNTEPGFAAVHGRLVETGDNGHPLFRLVAERIEQPTPQGIIHVTTPQLDYQLDNGNHWTLSAVRGELPQDASSADLIGNVHGEGLPPGSDNLMRLDTDVLHLDMPAQIATTPSRVHVTWAARSLYGRGMRFEMQRNHLELYADVRAALSR